MDGTNLEKSEDKNKNFIATKNDILELREKEQSIQIYLDEIKQNQTRLKAQTFLKKLHTNPDEKELKKNEFANNSKYLPISFLEMSLDELFFGAWSTVDFKFKVVANEMVGSLVIEYFHPTLNVWIKRVGAGAVMIQYEAQYEDLGNGKKKKLKTDITNIGLKITNTLTKDFPHLKAECFRNACLSIGKAFGRDLNREFQDQYNPILKAESKLTDQQKKILATYKMNIDDFTNHLELLSKKDSILKNLSTNTLPKEAIKEVEEFIQKKYDELKKGGK